MKIFFFQPSDIYYVHSCFWARWLESDFSISCWLGVLWNIRGWMGTVHVFLEMLLGPCRCSEWVAFTPNCHCLYAVVVLLFPSTVTSFSCQPLRVQQWVSMWSSTRQVLVRGQAPVCVVAEMQRRCLQCGSPVFDPWVGKILWRREWLPTPVFLLGESHGQRGLASCSPWGHKESDTTEWLTLSFFHLCMRGIM